MRECLTCGRPEFPHPYRHPFYPKGTPARLEEICPNPGLTKIAHKIVDRTNWDSRFLRLAEHVAGWSKDPSTKVGSVVVDAKRRVMGVGYNGFPRGVADDPGTLADRDQKYSLTVHAELNAILNSGDRLEGATLYSTLYPCNECAKAIIQVGILCVVTYRAENVRWMVANEIASDMFSQAGVLVVLK